MSQAHQGNVLILMQNITRLRQADTVRRDFISNISHELRTPLASLKALTETLQDGALDDPPAAHRFLTRMETEVDAAQPDGVRAARAGAHRIRAGAPAVKADPPAGYLGSRH